MHPGTYIGTIGTIFAVCIGVSIVLNNSSSGLPSLGTNPIFQSHHDVP